MSICDESVSTSDLPTDDCPKGTYRIGPKSITVSLGLQPHCYRRTDIRHVPDYSTGEITAQNAWCSAPSRCPHCARREAVKVARRVAASDPTALWLFTGLGEDWPAIHRSMRSIKQTLNRQGFMFEWAFVIEPSQRGSHAHVLVRGDDLPEAPDLALAAQRAGIGPFATTQAVRDLQAVSNYVLKIPRKRHAIDHPGYFHLNGDRLIHTSRGFYKTKN